MSDHAAIVKESGAALRDQAQVFGQGGTDGLILWALILATILMTVVALSAIILGYRAIAAKDSSAAADRKAFTDASIESAEALRELATAVASSASVDSMFKISMAGMMERTEKLLDRWEAERNARK